MKILIADKFESFGVTELKKLADEVACEPGLKDAALAQRIAAFDPTILIVRSTKVHADALKSGKRLKVANCPGMNAVAVAELVMGLMIALDRRIADNVADLRAHKWNKKEYSKA